LGLPVIGRGPPFAKGGRQSVPIEKTGEQWGPL
jgi:hypothetical protein